MNRRKFLKYLGIGSVVAVAPVIAKESYVGNRGSALIKKVREFGFEPISATEVRERMKELMRKAASMSVDPPIIISNQSQANEYWTMEHEQRIDKVFSKAFRNI